MPPNCHATYVRDAIGGLNGERAARYRLVVLATPCRRRDYANDLFWKGVALYADLFDLLCKCIGGLESDSATMRTAYACFLYMLDNLNGFVPDYDGQREHAIQSLLYC